MGQFKDDKFNIIIQPRFNEVIEVTMNNKQYFNVNFGSG